MHLRSHGPFSLPQEHCHDLSPRSLLRIFGATFELNTMPPVGIEPTLPMAHGLQPLCSTPARRPVERPARGRSQPCPSKPLLAIRPRLQEGVPSFDRSLQTRHQPTVQVSSVFRTRITKASIRPVPATPRGFTYRLSQHSEVAPPQRRACTALPVPAAFSDPVPSTTTPPSTRSLTPRGRPTAARPQVHAEAFALPTANLDCPRCGPEAPAVRHSSAAHSPFDSCAAVSGRQKPLPSTFARQREPFTYITARRWSI